MSTPTLAPDNNTATPPPLTVSAPQPDTPSSTPPAPDSVPSPVSTSPPLPDTQSPSSDSTSPPSPALALPPDTQLPPPAFASPPPPASAAPPDNQLPPPPTAPAPPTPAVSSPPPPSTSSPSPPPPSTSSPSPPPSSTSSPPPSSDSSPPPSTSSPPAISASPPPPSSSPPISSASPPPPPNSSPPSSSASPTPPTSSPPSSSASPPPSTTSPPSSSASPPPPSTSSPSTSASPPPSTSLPPTFSASPHPPSTFPSSPSTSPPPPSTSSPPTSSASSTTPPSTSSPPTSSASPTTPPSTSSPPTTSASPTTPPLTSSPPTSSASPIPPPSASSPPTSSASSTPTPSSFLPPSSSAFPPPPPSTSSTSPSLLLSPPPPLNSDSTLVDSSSSGISVAVVVGIAIGGVAILLVLILLFVCYRKKRRNHDSEAFHAQPPFMGYKDVPYGGPLPGPIMRLMSNASTPSPVNAYAPPFLLPSFNGTGSTYSGHETPPKPPPPGSVLGSSKSSFSYEELALATNGFSEVNLLGQGGFGYVHRGVLPNGKEVAIKQLKAGSGQGEREFQAEVEIISRVHHKHLVSLVGYCIAGSQRLLVYEYIPNNNLEFHLHEKGRPTMDWSARVRIALGSAKGLSYLHEDCNPKIIHRDIKAANILLDFKFEAKVADFGLAKFTLDIHTHVSTRVMGTFGYLAPEYASSGKLSEKSDVFSFGVVLLELITGHRPVDTTQTFMEDSLVDWARPLLVRAIEDENYDGLVDPKLQGNFIPTEMARMVACAAACVRHSAKRRPRMIQVVRALEGDATLADLNKGVRLGPSTACDESSDYDTTQYKEDMKRFRKMALESQEYGATGVAYSAGTSEYGLYPSSSSSSDAQTSREMEMKRWRNESLGLS